MKNKIIGLIKKNIMTLAYYLFRVFPIRKNKIVFSSFLGKGYGDNGKAICDRLLNDEKQYEIVWLCREMSDDFPDGIRKTAYYSVRSIYEQVTAKVWIDNRRKPGYVRKRKGQFYINTNHGNMGIKRLEFDAKEALGKDYLEVALNDSKMIDLYLSGSKFETRYLRKAFRYDGEVLECGYPRQDKLFNPSKAEIKGIKAKLGIPDAYNVSLYAPTFRANMTPDDLSVYNIDWDKTLSAMENRFHNKWVGLIRLHPNISALSKELDIPNSVIDVSNYPDFEELVLVSDCLISDYSSTAIEAAIVNKMVFLYATDIESYKKDRNFIIELEKFPYCLCKSNAELEKSIQAYSEEEYQKKRNDFFKNEYELCSTGTATDIVVDRIRSVIDK